MSAEPYILCRQASPCYGHGETYAPPLDCAVHPATLTCMLGPYRRDLSYYLRMLGGVERPCAGELYFDGREAGELDAGEWRRLHTRIGFVSSTTPLLSVLNGYDNVKLPAHYHRIADAKTIEERAQALIGAIDYEADHAVLPAYMTHLQRRHLTIARALIMGPEVLCLEAPLFDLDEFSVQRLQEYMVRLVREQAMALVVVTDHLLFMRENADQILFIGRHKTYTFPDWQSLLHSDDAEVRSYLDRQRALCKALE